MWVDVGKLISEHLPDKDGNVLPENLSMGTYEIRQPAELGVGSLFEGKVVYDKTYGHVTYGCATCCALKEWQFDYNPLGIPFEGTSQQSVEGVNNCQGTWTNTLAANTGGVGTTFTWSITAGSDKVSLSNSTSSTVQVTSIGRSSTANDVSITVTVGGLTSAPFHLTVRAPYTLGADPDFPTPVYASDPTYVSNITIYYDVLDNFLTPLPSTVSVNENWTTGIVPDYSGENWRRGNPGCASTGSSAGFGDFIGGEASTQTPTPVYNTQQNGAAVYHWGQEWRVGTCQNGSGPRVQTDTLQKYIDHAAHTNIVSPAP